MQLSPDAMRHIPEEELHAYLDQALSRSQCVEIEHHLAECTACRAERDAIAALRDRTTSLLVAAVPRRIRPRPFAQVSATHLERQQRRATRIRTLAWAASVVAALGLGWAASRATAPVVPTQAPQATGPTAPAPAPPKTASAPPRRATPGRPSAPSTPVRLAGLPASSPAPVDSTALGVPPRPATSELASLGGAGTAAEPVLDGMWRTVSWANAQNDGDGWLPRVEGVPVVQVKVRQSKQGGRPLTLVTQQLASGEMISTVEGPSPEVAALLSRQRGQSASAELQDMQVNPRAADSTTGHPAAAPAGPPRTLAIFGSAPSDSLKAFMLRVK
jgi:anti-sigma factor RsiW